MANVILTIPEGCESCCCEAVNITSFQVFVSQDLPVDCYVKALVNGVLVWTSTLILANDDPFILPLDPADFNPLLPGDVITVIGDPSVEFGGLGWGTPPTVAGEIAWDCVCGGVNFAKGTDYVGPATSMSFTLGCAGDWV